MSLPPWKFSESNLGIYHLKKFKNGTKHCQLWQIMVITEHSVVEYMVFKSILCRIQANIITRRHWFPIFIDLKLITWRILGNLGNRRLILTEFTSLEPLNSASSSLLVSKFARIWKFISLKHTKLTINASLRLYSLELGKAST